tara:strand:+ start:282 stop:1607 length:1326 start_codon:yes stop_codon:yes gene_type:complete
MTNESDLEEEQADELEAQSKIMREKAKLTEQMENLTDGMKNASWLENKPIRSHDDITKDYAEEFGMNLTDAKKALDVYPQAYEIQGNSIPMVVKEMRNYRRTLKGEPKIKFTKAIDNLIDGYSDYLNKCIESIYWVKKYKVPLQSMTCSESDLLKLSKISEEDTRRRVVDSLCKNWEANLDMKELSFGKEYASNLKKATEAKKEFKAILKETSINPSPKSVLKSEILKAVCNNPGISAREIHDSLEKNLYDKTSTAIIAKLAKEENITGVNGAYYKFNDEIKKNIWAYTAAFIDSDGYITMDKNHNPRVGLVATGDRGKAFMMEMYKSLGSIGRLHLDQKSPQDTRPVNRLNFYSGKDITKLLKNCLPHFRMKGPNAKVLLELIKIKKENKKADWYKDRKDELFKLMKYHNHKDNTNFNWNEWDIDIDGISKLEANSKMDV